MSAEKSPTATDPDKRAPSLLRRVEETGQRLLRRHEEKTSASDGGTAGVIDPSDDRDRLFDRHPLPMWIYDLETLRFLAVNDAAVANYGYSRAEFLDMTIADIRPPEDVPRLMENVAAVEAGVDRAGLWCHRRKDGSIVRVDISSHVTTFEGRKAQMVVAVDVTERFVAEEQLRASEMRLRTIFESEPACVKIVAADGMLLEMNPAGLQMIEARNIDEVRNRPLVDLVHPDDRAMFNDLHRRVLQGESGELRFRIVGLGNTRRWIETRSTPLREADGSIRAVLSVAHDVTARVREEKLLVAEARILERFVSGTELTTVLETIALAVDDLLPGIATSILLLDSDGAHVRHGAAPNLPQSFNEAIDGEPIGPMAGSCGTAAFTREPVIVTDIETDPRWDRYRELVRPLGFRACWSTPVLDDEGNVLATFALYDREPRAPDAFARSLVERFTHLIGIAVERTRRREALRESEARFRMIAQTTADVISDWDLAADTIWWNDGFRTVFGYSQSEIESGPESWMRHIHPDDRNRVVASLRDAIRQRKKRWSSEYRFLHKDGSVLDIEDRVTITMGSDGTPVRLIGGMTDITTRKRLEARLRENEERFRIISETSADRFWDWDLETGRFWWSGHDGNSGESDIGTGVDADLGEKIWGDRLHPDDRDRVVQSFIDAIEHGREKWIEQYRYRDNYDTWIELEDHGKLIRNDDGKLVRFVGGMTDITARKRAERDLRERIKELNCLYRAVELTAGDDRPVDAICADIAALLPESVMHDGIAVARIVVDGGEQQSLGWADPVATLSAPIRVAGKDIGVVELGYREERPDVPSGEGPFLREERALVNAVATHVGRMIGGRRMAETLAQSEKLRSIGELTGGVAHDFNNLLTIVLGSTEMLSDMLEDQPKLRDLAETAMAASIRGAELTSRLLAFGRRQPLDPKVTDVDALIAGMEPLLRRSLGERVELEASRTEKSRSDRLWQVLVDRNQLENALLNLCINARDAMPEGGRLTIETRNVSLSGEFALQHADLVPGQYVLVAVSDTGCGMTPEIVARAFDPFFTTKDVGKGSGLGLSMVYGFIKQSRGHVAIYSEPGHGTTVKLYLPSAEPGAVVAAMPDDAAAAVGGHERILLVEDDDLVRAHVAAQLEALGYRVAPAPNGPAALAALRRSEDIDLLFTDVVMPGGMNGRELADEARRLRPFLPILYTSGYTEDAIVHHGKLDRDVHLLAKPYRRQELAAKLREALAVRAGD